MNVLIDYYRTILGLKSWWEQALDLLLALIVFCCKWCLIGFLLGTGVLVALRYV